MAPSKWVRSKQIESLLASWTQSRTEMTIIRTEMNIFRTEMPNIGTEMPKLGTDMPNLRTELPNIGTDMPKFRTDVVGYPVKKSDEANLLRKLTYKELKEFAQILRKKLVVN